MVQSSEAEIVLRVSARLPNRNVLGRDSRRPLNVDSGRPECADCVEKLAKWPVAKISISRAELHPRG
jgi:hypothetical protein